MHPAAFADAVEGLSQNPSCVFAFGSSVMHFFSGDKLVGIRSRMCPYSQPGVYPGAATRQLFINYPTDVVVARTQKLREIGGFFRESIRWNALLQSRGDVFFTGKPCLISGKYGANLSADWGKNGRTGEISMKEIGSVLVSDRFTPAERFVAFVLSASIFSGTSVFRIMEAVSRDRGDRGYAQFLSVKKEEIVVELFKVLAGQFPFRSDSLTSDVQPQTHSGNVFCSKTEFLAFRDSIWRADLARELSVRPDTAWAFS